MRVRRVPGALHVPAVATVLAVSTLAAPFWPALFPLVLAGGAAAACALALLRRPSRPLVLAVAGVALWLATGLAGAWALRSRPLAGFAWVLAVLFLVPLPILPWLYSRTFTQRPDLPRAPGPPTTASGDGGGA